jgi:hypothetical protein
MIFQIAETTATNSVSVTSVKLQLVVLKGKELSVSGAEKSLRKGLHHEATLIFERNLPPTCGVKILSN